MENKPFKPTTHNGKKIAAITAASILLVGIIGYGTVSLLHLVQAPTLSADTPTLQQPAAATQPKVSPEKALAAANASYESASKKADAGDQAAALVDYKVAYKNYTLANDTTRAKDVEFVIKSIETALAAEENPIKPGTGKASAKE